MRIPLQSEASVGQSRPRPQKSLPVSDALSTKQEATIRYSVHQVLLGNMGNTGTRCSGVATAWGGFPRLSVGDKGEEH